MPLTCVISRPERSRADGTYDGVSFPRVGRKIPLVPGDAAFGTARAGAFAVAD